MTFDTRVKKRQICKAYVKNDKGENESKVSVSVALQEKKPMTTRKKKIMKKGGRYNSKLQVK